MSTERTLKTVIAEIKASYDLADYIENSGVSLKRMGNRSKGLCPFHNENTPSFTVDDNFQNYHCFGCGVHGDIIHFVQENDNLSFWEAIESLATNRNIAMPEKSGDYEKGEDVASLREIVRESAIFFWKLYQKLPEDHVAKKEITNRKLSSDNKYNIYGYAPEGKDKLYKFLKSKGFSDDSIEKTGVCRKSEYGFFDAWQGRLMFIISDITGRPVGFSGRKLYETDKMGKYVNSIDSLVFNKSNVLFNINNAKKQAKEKSEIYVGEGQFDVMSVLESENSNVVASSGTAFTERQSSQLRRLVGESGIIIFIFDGDEAGREAARKVFDTDPMIHNRAYVVSFPEGQDPDDYAQQHGHQALGEYISNPKNRISITEFVLGVEKDNADMSTPEGRSRYLERASEVLSKVSAQSLRNEYAKLVSLEAGGVSLDSVEALVAEVKSNAKPVRKREENPEGESSEDERAKALEEESAVSEEETERINLEELKEKMKSDSYYKVLARLMWILLARRDLVSERIYAIQKALIPGDLRRIIEEVHHYPEELSMIPEKFTDQDLIEDIIKHHKPSSYFVSGDDEMVQEMLEIVIERLVRMRVRTMRDKNRAKLTGLIADSEASQSVFEKIIAQEEQQYEKAEILEKTIQESKYSLNKSG